MSIFYQARFHHRFPIPLLAFEHLEHLREQDLPPEVIVGRVIEECCHVRKPSEQDLSYFLQRLHTETQEAKAQVPEAEPEPEEDWMGKPHVVHRKTLGTSFNEMLAEMDSATILLWACGWDYQRAEYLYTVADRSVAMQVISTFIRTLREGNTYLFEATLYGFGGSYKDDDGSDEADFDMTDMDAAGIMAMLSSH